MNSPEIPSKHQPPKKDEGIINRNIIRPLAGFDQRMRIITAFRWWPLSLVTGIVLLAIWEFNGTPMRGGGDVRFTISYWTMITSLVFGILPPMAKYMITPHSKKVDEFPFKHFLKLLLISFAILALIFILLSILVKSS